MRASGYAAIAYGVFDILTGKPEDRFAFLAFAGALSIGLFIFFTVMHVKGYRWIRDDAKTSPPAKEDNEGV
jgi:hypothetical protein